MINISSWSPIFSSSGGSAHLNAAKYLQEESSLPKESMPVINVMESGCVMGETIGKRLVAHWDNAQKLGDVKKQVLLVKLQSLFEALFFLPAYITMISILLSRGDKHLPDQVIATSPMLLAALCWAIRTVNCFFGSETNRIEALDLYMVEPPTEGAVYYLRALRGLSVANKALVRLHGLPPKDPEFITRLGLKEFAQEPVTRKAYRESHDLPKPGEKVTVQLKMQDPAETAFLAKHNGGVFDIKPEDRVGLIMLGGVPTASAIKDYLEAAIAVAKQKNPRSGNNYLFIACGRPDDPNMLKLYKDVVARIEKMQEEQVSGLIIVPFTGQPVDKIFSRADLSDTRSGGMTSQEIMCLKTNPRRNDPKRVLIHAQLQKRIDPVRYAHRALAMEMVANPKTEVSDEALREAYQRALIRQGVPLWEGSNAQYLREKVEAEVLTPAGAQEVMEEVFLGRPRASMTFNAEIFNKELAGAKKAYQAALLRVKAQRYASIIAGTTILLGVAASALLFTSLMLLSPWVLIGAIAASLIALGLIVAMARFNPRKYVVREMLA